MRRLGAAVALAVPLLCAGVGHAAEEDPGRPTIYKWVDENGIAHYTTDKKRVPRNLRNRIRDVDEMRAEQAEAAKAAAPPPAPAPPAMAVSGDEAEAGEPVGREEFEPDTGFTTAPTPSAAPATPPATAAGADDGGTTAPAYPPLTGPPGRSDLYAVQDRGSEPEPRGPGRGDFMEGEDPLAEPGEVPLDAALIARRDELDQQIAGLEAELAREERRLKELISEAREVDGRPAPLYGVPELEELARRFPELQAQIAALRAERRALEQAN